MVIELSADTVEAIWANSPRLTTGKHGQLLLLHGKRSEVCVPKVNPDGTLQIGCTSVDINAVAYLIQFLAAQGLWGRSGEGAINRISHDPEIRVDRTNQPLTDAVATSGGKVTIAR